MTIIEQMIYYCQEVQKTVYNNVSFTGINRIVTLRLLRVRVMITERDGVITAFTEGKRATAELTRMKGLSDADGIAENSYWEDEWFFLRTLVNQSGEKGLGTRLLDEVLDYCRQKKYSVLHIVHAYGGYRQKETEDWFISKGFKPLNYEKYNNGVLIFRG